MKYIIFIFITISNLAFGELVVNDGRVLNCNKQTVFDFNPEEKCSKVDSVLTNGVKDPSITKTSINALELSTKPSIEFTYNSGSHNGYVAYIYGNGGTCTSKVGFVLKNCIKKANINISDASIKENAVRKSPDNITYAIANEKDQAVETNNIKFGSQSIVSDNLKKGSFINPITLTKSLPSDNKIFDTPKIPKLAELESIKLDNLKNYNSAPEENKLMPTVPQTECPTFRPRLFKFFAEIYGGVSYAPKDLSINSNSDEIMASLLLELRDSTETSLETVQAGVLVGAYHKKSRLAIMTGLQYSKITEKLNYVTSTTVYDSIPDQILHYLVTLDGDTVPVYGTIVNETITTSTKKVFNDHAFLDIPFIAEFSILDKRSPPPLFVNVQLGVNANINLNSKGKVLDQSLNTVPLSDIIKERVGLSYFASVGLNYKWNDNITFKVAPYFKFMPDEITFEEYELKQQYSIFGINLSARYYFSYY